MAVAARGGPPQASPGRWLAEFGRLPVPGASRRFRVPRHLLDRDAARLRRRQAAAAPPSRRYRTRRRMEDSGAWSGQIQGVWGPGWPDSGILGPGVARSRDSGARSGQIQEAPGLVRGGHPQSNHKRFGARGGQIQEFGGPEQPNLGILGPGVARSRDSGARSGQIRRPIVARKPRPYKGGRVGLGHPARPSGGRVRDGALRRTTFRREGAGKGGCMES